ncbi:MAG: TonB family protein [Pseudomonadota bacterium]
MIIKRVSLLGFLFLSLCGGLAYADNSDDWKTLTNQSTAFSEKKQYGEAFKSSSQALAIAEQDLAGPPIRTAVSLIQLGRIQETVEHFADAEMDYLKALTVQAKILPVNQRNIAENLIYLARIYDLQGKPTDAERVSRDAIQLLEKSGGREDTRLLPPLHLLGRAYLAQKKYDAANPVLTRAIAISEKNQPVTAIELKGLQNTLADLYRKIGKETEATNMEQRAAAIPVGDSKKSIAFSNMDFSRCHPEWPREALRYGLQGKIQLKLLVDVDGQIMATEVVKSSGWKILDLPVIDTIKQCRVMPAMRDGNPLQTWAKINYMWKIDDNVSAPELVKDSCAPSDSFKIASASDAQPAIRLRFLVNAEGTPFGIKLEDSSNDPDLDQAAMALLASCKYKLSTAQGKLDSNAGNIRFLWEKKGG